MTPKFSKRLHFVFPYLTKIHYRRCFKDFKDEFKLIKGFKDYWSIQKIDDLPNRFSSHEICLYRQKTCWKMAFFSKFFPLHTKLALLGRIRGQKITFSKKYLWHIEKGGWVIIVLQRRVFWGKMPDLKQSYQIVLFLVLQAFFERQMRLS